MTDDKRLKELLAKRKYFELHPEEGLEYKAEIYAADPEPCRVYPVPEKINKDS